MAPRRSGRPRRRRRRPAPARSWSVPRLAPPARGGGGATRSRDRVGIHTTGRQIGRPDDLDPQPAGERQVHDLVRCVVRPAGEDRVSRGEIEGAQRLGEGDRGVLGQGNVSAPSTHQPAQSPPPGRARRPEPRPPRSRRARPPGPDAGRRPAVPAVGPWRRQRRRGECAWCTRGYPGANGQSSRRLVGLPHDRASRRRSALQVNKFGDTTFATAARILTRRCQVPCPLKARENLGVGQGGEAQPAGLAHVGGQIAPRGSGEARRSAPAAVGWGIPRGESGASRPPGPGNGKYPRGSAPAAGQAHGGGSGETPRERERAAAPKTRVHPGFRPRRAAQWDPADGP